MLQGKPKDEREEQAQRAERERLEKLKIDDEWAGGANSGMHQPCLAGPLPQYCSSPVGDMLPMPTLPRPVHE